LQRRRRHPPEVRQGKACGVALGLHGDVTAGREDVAGTAQHDRACVRVVVGAGQRGEERFEHLGCEAVLALWTMHCDEGDLVAQFVEHGRHR